jgi:hypothetical protein
LGEIIMLFKEWFKKNFSNNRANNERIEQLIKESKVKAAELAVCEEAEAISLKETATEH